jgi:transcription elongation factor Elf1
MTEMRECPFCGSTRTDTVIDLDDRIRGICLSCGTEGQAVQMKFNLETDGYEEWNAERQRVNALAEEAWNRRSSDHSDDYEEPQAKEVNIGPYAKVSYVEDPAV